MIYDETENITGKNIRNMQIVFILLFFLFRSIYMNHPLLSSQKLSLSKYSILMQFYLDQVSDETSFFVTATAATTSSKAFVPTNTSPTTMILTSTTSPNCDASTQIQLSNNTCLSKIDLQVQQKTSNLSSIYRFFFYRYIQSIYYVIELMMILSLPTLFHYTSLQLPMQIHHGIHIISYHQVKLKNILVVSTI